MAANDLPFLRARVQAFKTNLEKTAHKQKTSMLTYTLGEQFDNLLKEILDLYPEVKRHLPEPVCRETGMGVKRVTINYLDLEIMVDTLINILGVIETKR
jgi:hypothetical protein